MSAAGRLRSWLAQWRGVPARAERVDRIAVALESTVADVASRLDALDRLEGLDADRRVEARALQDAAALALAEARGRHEDVAGWVTRTDLRVVGVGERLGGVAHEQRVALEASLAERRDTTVAELLDAHGYRGTRRPGLSVITITWNHATWLREAARSAARVLDAAGDRAGVHLILDDGSTDETAAVLDELGADDRVVVVRSPRNLNLARARNILLAACPTEHAVVLDADNRLLEDGVLAALDVAQRYRPTIAWGQVVASDAEGGHWDAFAYAPAPETLRNGLCFDSMAVVDVAAVESLGGYSTDPQLGGVVDDYELLLRTLRRGHLVTYVPVVLGRYRISGLRHSALAADHSLAARRVERMYLYDDPDPTTFAVAAVHPTVGVLWAWDGALDRISAASGDDDTAELESAAPGSGSDASALRLLLVAPGGVGNLGDDAITWSVLDRLRAELPDASIRVVTDRGVPPQRPRRQVVPVCWDGTVLELWRGLPPQLLERGSERLGVDPHLLRPDRPGPSIVELAEFDAVIVAGGGNLADDFADDVMLPRLALAACAGTLGLPVVWSGQGIGPLRADRLDLLRAVLTDAAAVGVRDPGSADLVGGSGESVAAGGVTHPGELRVELVGDDAAGVPAATAAARDTALRRSGVDGGPYVVAHLRDAPYVSSEGAADIVAAVDALAERRDASVVALVVNDNGPGEHATVLAALERHGVASRWAVLDASGDPELAVAVLAGAEAAVVHSFHLALWGLLAGTPSLLVADSDYYAAKAAGLGATCSLGDAVAVPGDADADMLQRRLELVRTRLDVAPGASSDRSPDWLTVRLRQVLRGSGPNPG